MEMASAHGGHLAPAGSCDHMARLEFLAAPRAQDHIGCAPRHFERIGDDAVLAERLARQFGKAILASCDSDELGHPADAGDLRLVPFLEVDARASGKACGAGTNGIEPALELLDERLR